MMNNESLPPHWKSTTLNDKQLFAFESGIWTGDKPPLVECAVIRNTNFTDNGRLDFSNVAKIQIEQRKFAMKRLAWGDIVVERSGGGPEQPVGRVAFFDLKDGDYCFSNFTSRLRVVDANIIDPQFLHHYLLQFHLSGGTLTLQRRTTGIRNLDFEQYKKIAIALPPPEEQHAIVHALRTVQEAIEARRRELELERERKAALMQHLFTHGTRGEKTKQTDIGEMPESWEVVRLESCASKTKYAFVDGPFGSNLKSIHYTKTGILVIQSQYVTQGKFRITAPIYTSEEKATEQIRSNAKAGDIVIAKIGVNFGASAIVPPEIDRAVLAGNTMKITVDESHVRSNFLVQLLNYLKDTGAIARVLQTKTAQPALSLSVMKNLHIPRPDVDEQELIADVLFKCDARIHTLEGENALLEELFRAMLEELMTGKLSTTSLVV